MNNLPISSAPQPSGNVVNASQPDDATANNDQATVPFAKVLARKVDKSPPPDSNANADTNTSSANAAPPALDQAVVPVDALNAILSQIPIEMRGTNVADHMTQLASGDRAAATLDPAASRMTAAAMTASIPAPTPSATKGDTAFQNELSNQNIQPGPLTGTDKNTAGKTNDLLATPEQQFLADALRQSVSSRQDLAANSPPPSQINAASFSQSTVAAMTGAPTGNQSAAATQTISTPLASPSWGEDFSQKINWMVSQKSQVAELHLNPPNLGPLDVTLKISDNQATAMFTSPHAAVRDVVENALPKLRELLADNGIMLSNASVGDQAPRDRGQGGPADQKALSGNRSADNTNEAAGAMQTLPVSRHNGMVDTFA